jgi:NAD(P)-dependent dehydrogenase (short-subunit alcohol dehydrogenase family)
MFSYAGKTALVTGAGRGIGRAIALAFAEQGADVALASRTREELDAVAEEIRQRGRRAWVFPTDLGDMQQAQALIGEAAGAMGRLDVLVNNAGGGYGSGGYGPLDGVTPEGFSSIFELNVRCPFFAAQAAARIMQGQGGGCVLNIVSIDGLFPAPTEGVYGAAKAALISLTGTLAVELGEHKIRVNAIAPGLVETKLTARVFQNDEMRTDRASLYPINRVGVPQDIAGAAVYLCSDEAAWVSGETLLIAGGQKATGDVFRWLRSHNPVPEGSRM